MNLPRTQLFLATAVLAMCLMPLHAKAAYVPFVGEVQVLAGSFCPVGWLPLEGQVLPIAQFDTLFTLIGTTYGGDGVQTFALPLAIPLPTLTNGTQLIQCIAVQGIFPVHP